MPIFWFVPYLFIPLTSCSHITFRSTNEFFGSFSLFCMRDMVSIRNRMASKFFGCQWLGEGSNT